jgi:16S rRNA (uracil1498-N3)-methyltransferase
VAWESEGLASLYLDPALDAGVTPGSRVRFGGDEARHAATVARVRPGERLSVGDGAGTIVSGRVLVAEAGVVEIEVEDVRREPAPVPAIWLAQALAKGDRDELAIQAATELGVSGVIPWAAERSVVRWEGPKAARGRERWGSIVREASKQAIRAWVPEAAELATTAILARVAGALVVLDPEAALPISAAPVDVERIVLVVGPEGGITPAELAAFDAAGAIRVRLGREVLRTSTAGPAALAVLNARLGRW